MIRKTPRALRTSATALLAAAFASLASAQSVQTWAWFPMPMLSAAQQSAGVFPGGEGFQWPQAVATDPVDGTTVLYGTDVGGLFRSTDGGANFTPANIGLETCGVVGLAFDPRNRHRVLLIGDGGGNAWNIYGGVHLSTDGGATWNRRLSRVLDAIGTNSRQMGRDQIAFSYSSYDAGLGRTQVVYWVSEDDFTPTTYGGGTIQYPGGALFKSLDGGSTWSLAATADKYGGANDADSRIAVHPATGVVYIANKNGFWRSTDGGASFTQIRTGSHRACEIVTTPGYENYVWTATSTELLRSTDSGQNFSPVSFTGITGFMRLKVSSANPQRMLASNNSWARFRSTDGGATWTSSAESSTNSLVLTLGTTDANRRAHAAFHPTNADIIYALGVGDQLMKSTNGGANFSWSSNGINGIMTGGGFNFNTQNPDVLYLGSQDYNGMLTTNAGTTWRHINLEGGDNWGWVYGAYAKSSQVLFGGNKAYLANSHNLIISFDGGATRQTKVTGLTGLQVSYGDPTDSNILFCWSQRSTDGGANWTQMADCNGVFTHHPTTNALFGGKGNELKRSTTKGASWTTLATLPGTVTDVAPHPTLDRLWVAAAEKLYRLDGPAYTPVEVLAGNRIRSVAIDPLKPETIYVAGTNGTWRKSTDSVRRSTDGGTSWHRLIALSNQLDGGNCAEWVRVHPTTGVAYFATNCFGVWTFEPPTAPAGTAIPAEADTYVRGNINTNPNPYHTEPHLVVKDDTGTDYDRQAYLRFDLSGITGTLQTAQLRLFVNRLDVGPATYELCETTDSWTESGLTWSGRPAAVSVIASTTISVGGELIFDVKDFVAAKLAGNKKASFLIRRGDVSQTPGSMLFISSRDHANASERPALHYTATTSWTITAASSDAEARLAGAGDGGGTVGNAGATELAVANANNAGSAYSAVYAFQLPNVGNVANPFTSASFTVGLSTSTSTWGGQNLDVYGLGARSSATVLASDAFCGSLDSTDATRLVDNWINLNVGSVVPTGLRTVSNSALLSYLNTQYASGAGAGKFVFLRISPDAMGNTWKNVKFAASEYTANPAWRPTLTLQ